MIFHYMFKASCARDPGTFHQFKCKLNGKDVNEKITKVFHGWEFFFSTVLVGYVVYAAMEYFGMASLDDSHSKNLPRRGAEGSSSLFKKVGEMVVLLEVQPETVVGTCTKRSK